MRLGDLIKTNLHGKLLIICDQVKEKEKVYLEKTKDIDKRLAKYAHRIIESIEIDYNQTMKVKVY
jgi:hypothetical protein